MAFEPVTPPRQDEWYRAPAGFDREKPGTILRVRSAPGDLVTKVNNASAAYNILFSTTGSNYEPSWAVTTLLLPKTASRHALLSYQIPYNSVDLNGSPSFLIHKSASDFWPDILTTAEQALGEGWSFNLPDFEGPLAAVGDGVIAGHATLDSIRSVLDANFGMDRVKTRVALWGFSGGALASAWAAELQAHYAPGLSFAGAALGGVPPDIMVVENSSGTMFAGQVPLLLLGITATSPQAREEVVSNLKPDRREDFLATLGYDVATAFQKFAGQDIYEYFTNGRDILRHSSVVRLVQQKSRLGHHGAPIMPLFIYASVRDEIVPIKHIDALVEKYRWVGANILYERNTEGSHLAEAKNGQGRALSWLRTVLGETYSHEGCTVKDVTVAV